MSLIHEVINYYADRAPVYDMTAGYTDPQAEVLRAPIKERYRELFRGRNVLEVACGSGYWTRVIGEVAASVLAVDINRPMLSIAAEKCRDLPNVRFQLANAYRMGSVPGGFDAAFACWWWSHVPLSHLRIFLTALHKKLNPGALVMFVDRLECDESIGSVDADGNTFVKRQLPGDRSYLVLKNYPTRRQVTEYVADFADEIRYTERPDERSWEIVYRAAARQPAKTPALVPAFSLSR